MTINQLKQHVAQANRNNVFSKAEVKTAIDIVGEKVSNGEAKVLADVFSKLSQPEPGFRAGVGAAEALDKFAGERGLPIGETQVAAYAQAIQDLLMVIRMGPPRDEPTMRLSSYVAIPVRDGMVAYIDLVKKRFELEMDGGPNGKSYLGPLGLPAVDTGAAAQKQLRATRKDFLVEQANALLTAGTIDWRPNDLLAGVRFVDVPLTDNRYPDAINITMRIPVGPLVPGQAGEDPNRVGSYYLHQTGGIVGFDQVAGPFDV
jgi:hypothetical protein